MILRLAIINLIIKDSPRLFHTSPALIRLFNICNSIQSFHCIQPALIHIHTFIFRFEWKTWRHSVHFFVLTASQRLVPHFHFILTFNPHQISQITSTTFIIHVYSVFRSIAYFIPQGLSQHKFGVDCRQNTTSMSSVCYLHFINLSYLFYSRISSYLPPHFLASFSSAVIFW